MFNKNGTVIKWMLIMFYISAQWSIGVFPPLSFSYSRPLRYRLNS